MTIVVHKNVDQCIPLPAVCVALSQSIRFSHNFIAYCQLKFLPIIQGTELFGEAGVLLLGAGVVHVDSISYNRS